MKKNISAKAIAKLGKKTRAAKAKQAKIAKLAAGAVVTLADGRQVTIPTANEPEAIPQAIADDKARANGEQPAADAVPVTTDVAPVDNRPIQIPDELTASWETWNCKGEDVKPIVLRDASRSILARFEYVPEPLMAGAVKTDWSILRCNDNGRLVGKPFAGSYGLLDNNGFMGIIETICAVLDKMGIKWSIATTGSLMDRERTFVSIKMEGFDSYQIDGREIKAFLNCLNSIPSNSGCTVTFANNTFTVCCRNTFAMALHNKEGAKFHAAIKHTSGMRAMLADVPVMVEAYISGNQELFANLKAFSEFAVDAPTAEGYFAAFIGRTAKGELSDKVELTARSAGMVDTLAGLFTHGKGNKGRTAFDLFNAITEYYTHMSAGESDNKLKQYTSSEAGAGLVSKGEFYQWLVMHTQTAAGVQGVARVGDTLLINYRKARG